MTEAFHRASLARLSRGYNKVHCFCLIAVHMPEDKFMASRQIDLSFMNHRASWSMTFRLCYAYGDEIQIRTAQPQRAPQPNRESRLFSTKRFNLTMALAGTTLPPAGMCPAFPTLCRTQWAVAALAVGARRTLRAACRNKAQQSRVREPEPKSRRASSSQ